MSNPILASESALWIQTREDAGTPPDYLGCHDVGDISIPGGAINRIWCPDRAASGRFKAVGSYRDEPGTPTTTITTPVTRVRDILESLTCPATVFVHKVTCGRRDVFSNYDRSMILYRAAATDRTYSGMAVRQPGDNDQSLLSVELGMQDVINVFRLDSTAQSVAATTNLLAIAFAENERCAGPCGPAVSRCQYGVVVGAASDSPPAVAPIYFTTDGGETWAVSTSDPFAVGESISAVVHFWVGRNTRRTIVARGTADAGNPAEVAYSDDGGASWTAVDVGSVNGQYVPGANAMCFVDMYHLWLVTNDGYIYFSDDGGASWTAQESGSVTTDPLYCVRFMEDGRVGYAAGSNNAILKTVDGGGSWAALVGPTGGADVRSMDVRDEYTVWLGYSDGELWYTTDGGDSWAQAAPGFSTGVVQAIKFTHPAVGWLLHDTTAPVASVYRSINFGATWERVVLPTNAGATGLWACDENLAYVAGNVSGSTAVIAKVLPES